MRARAPAHRGCGRPRPAGRGGGAGAVVGVAHPDAGRALLSAGRHHLELGVRHRSGAGDGRAANGLPARQGARRLVFHQRHGLYPRESARLRRVGPDTRPGALVVFALPAVFQTGGDPRHRPERLPRRRRPAARHPVAADQSVVRGVHGVRRRGRVRADRRSQRLSSGRVRADGSHHVARPARRRRVLLPRSRALAPQSRGAHAHAGFQDHRRRGAGHGSRVHRGGGRRARPRRARGRLLRRGRRFAADPAAIGCRGPGIPPEVSASR